MRRRHDLRLKVILVVGMLIGVVLGTTVTIFAAKHASVQKQAEVLAAKDKLQLENKTLKNKVIAETSADLIVEQNDEMWNLVLINEDHPLDTSYVPELVEIAPERMVDSRIAEDANRMMSDAQAEGMDMYICSAYRSYDQQKEVFEATMQDWINKGAGMFDAYNETKKSVAVPGSSEHASGLALDIVSKQYEELDDRQAETPEAQWLAKNCWEYGFILRYPPEKADVTGIIYEPWHYRYVGKEAAKEIMEQGTTLEEYLGAAN